MVKIVLHDKISKISKSFEMTSDKTNSNLQTRSDLKMNGNTNWGRSVNPQIISTMTFTFLIFLGPVICHIFLSGAIFYNGSLWDAIINFQLKLNMNINVLMFLSGWYIWQFILFVIPDYLHYWIKSYRGGIQKGQHTPGGHILEYNINGLQALIITHLVFMIGYYTKLIHPHLLIQKWMELFVVANIIGYLISIVAYLKGRIYPTHLSDVKITGNFMYDFFLGIEFNPRIPNQSMIDIKLFLNGRPGIIAWPLINLCCCFYQYHLHGYLTNSIIIVTFLHYIYVIDFFYNEAWYLKTIDIAHDHFGWMLSWGDCVWLPFMYTLQALYLSYHPIILETMITVIILFMGLSGYMIFRYANYQKDKFKVKVHDIEANQISETHIICFYHTNDGKIHESKLLVDGLWAYARHMNYTGDIIFSFACCAACGLNHILPYFYVIYMVILLVTRCFRDEDRCHNKYGKFWDVYCERVPYRFIPYLY